MPFAPFGTSEPTRLLFRRPRTPRVAAAREHLGVGHDGLRRGERGIRHGPQTSDGTRRVAPGAPVPKTCAILRVSSDFGRSLGFGV